MLPVYVGALVLAAIVLVFQLVVGHHGTGDAHPAGHDADGGATPLTFLASLRFWSFSLLAFGLTGALIHALGFAEPPWTLGIAAASGLAAGVLAVSVLRTLARRSTSSHASADEVVGKVGVVVVPPNERGACKVRVELRGSSVDYVAHASEPLAGGDAVLVEELEGDGVVVSKAPRELKP